MEVCGKGPPPALLNKNNCLCLNEQIVFCNFSCNCQLGNLKNILSKTSEQCPRRYQHISGCETLVILLRLPFFRHVPLRPIHCMPSSVPLDVSNPCAKHEKKLCRYRPVEQNCYRIFGLNLHWLKPLGDCI